MHRRVVGRKRTREGSGGGEGGWEGKEGGKDGEYEGKGEGGEERERESGDRQEERGITIRLIIARCVLQDAMPYLAYRPRWHRATVHNNWQTQKGRKQERNGGRKKTRGMEGRRKSGKEREDNAVGHWAKMRFTECQAKGQLHTPTCKK